MRLLGLTGAAGAGKDTVAEHLVYEHGWQAYALAGPIKRMLIGGLGLQWADFSADRKEVALDWLGVSPRYLMQRLGTEWGRDQVRPDLWLLLADRYLRSLQAAHESGALQLMGCVITDIRFPAEALWLAQRGGLLWRIERPGVSPVEPHVSEQHFGLMEPERILVNDGSLTELRAQVSAAYSELAMGGWGVAA